MALPAELTLFLTSIVAWAALYLIVSLSLNLEFGFTGIPNFRKALTQQVPGSWIERWK